LFFLSISLLYFIEGKSGLRSRREELVNRGKKGGKDKQKG